MSRVTWHDAYPDHPDNHVGRISLARSSDDEIFNVPEVDLTDIPTRPLDAQLLPAHKHNCGHWCHRTDCNPSPYRRASLCDNCEFELQDRRGRQSPFGKRPA